MNKKKIALFHPWLKSKGGAEKVVLELLKDKDNEVDIFTWCMTKKKLLKNLKNIL